MNAEILDLRAFVTIADLGTFVQTARLLNLSQPALSRRIQRLEENLGAPLLERSTRHVALTRVGREFLPHARALVENFESSVLAIRSLGEHSTGVVNIAAVPTVAFRFLPPALARFATAYPRIRVRILDMVAHDGLEAVLQGQADFGINFLGAADPEIDFTPLLVDPFMLACRRDHRFAARTELSWSELHGERVVIVGRNGGNRMLIDNALAHHGATLDWSYEVMHVSGALELVRAGLGVTVLPGLGSPPTGEEGLATVRLVAPEVSRTIGIVRRHAAPPAPAAARLLEMLLATWPAPPRGRILNHAPSAGPTSGLLRT